jgi:hypothetical protein
MFNLVVSSGPVGKVTRTHVVINLFQLCNNFRCSLYDISGASGALQQFYDRTNRPCVRATITNRCDSLHIVLPVLSTFVVCAYHGLVLRMATK